MKHYDVASFPEMAGRMKRSFHSNYLAMYSSIFDGIVTDPVLMTLPIDDHMVHRGDGVFEVFKCINGNIYNLKAHLERLQKSAEMLDYKLPKSPAGMTAMVVELIQAGGVRDVTVHLYISRGPGSLGVNPYDCARTEMYIVVAKLKKPFMYDHPQGARVITSSAPPKTPYYAAIKSCNYLPNVLMKKEAEEKGADFAVGFDEKGFMTEGATENMGIVTGDNRLMFPNLHGILCGTTMIRTLELAEQLVASGDLAKVVFSDITREMVLKSREMLIVGTTPNVAMVREFDGQLIAGGQPGQIFRKLSRLLEDDIEGNSALHTKALL